MTGPCEPFPSGNGTGDAAASGIEAVAPPGWEDAEAAVARLRQVFPPSPLLRAKSDLGRDLLLKADTLLPTGSFKVRGIWDAVSQLSEERVAPGLSTVSAGNTALALAWAARRRGVPAFSLLPETAPPAKIEGFRAAGGTPRLVTVPELFRFLPYLTEGSSRNTSGSASPICSSTPGPVRWSTAAMPAWPSSCWRRRPRSNRSSSRWAVAAC